MIHKIVCYYLGSAVNGRLFTVCCLYIFSLYPLLVTKCREQEMWCATDSGTCGAKSTDFSFCRTGCWVTLLVRFSGCATAAHVLALTLMRIHKLVHLGDCNPLGAGWAESAEGGVALCGSVSVNPKLKLLFHGLFTVSRVLSLYKQMVGVALWQELAITHVSGFFLSWLLSCLPCQPFSPTVFMLTPCSFLS